MFREGTVIRAGYKSEDLGLCTTAAVRRSVQTHPRRIAAGNGRAERVRTLAYTNAGASKLYRSGVATTQEYGHPGTAASPSMITQMRAAAVKAAALPGTRPCTACVIAWKLGEGSDPALRIPVAQITAWRKLWDMCWART